MGCIVKVINNGYEHPLALKILKVIHGIMMDIILIPKMSSVK